MMNDWFELAGGLGLFLFGMSTMTDGLRGLAGDALHRVLSRFTRSATTGAMSGALVTALLQSSSATTVAAVGFVSAGLLTFVQALGIIFGANLGTTITGWLVALLGFKLSIGTVTLPLILVGALMRLLGRGRLASGGTALAGFGLIFVGIGLLQQGMQAFQGTVTPEVFPDDTVSGRLWLLLIGIAITLVTQSSSAGVATALTALYTGTIDFPQAAAMVIGMDVGTTVTAALATIGGSRETRRTGYSHVMYNLITAAGALLLLTPYTQVWEYLAPGALTANTEIALVGFHSVFNLVGVLLVLPVARQFARMMYLLVPEGETQPTDSLDRLLLREPSVALDAAAHVAQTLLLESLRMMQKLLQAEGTGVDRQIELLSGNVERLQRYVDEIHLRPEQTRDWRRLNALIHMLDHLDRMLDRCADQLRRDPALAEEAGLHEAAVLMNAQVSDLLSRMQTADRETTRTAVETFAKSFHQRSEDLRAAIAADMAAGRLDIPQGTSRLDTVRWMRRSATHLARIYLHMAAMEAVGFRGD